MSVFRVFAGHLPAEDEEAVRPLPVRLSSVEMLNRWAANAFFPSHDGGTLVINEPDGFALHRGGRSTHVPIDFSRVGIRKVAWHPDGALAAFWAPPADGEQSARIALLDPSRPTRHATIYAPEGRRAPFGMEWSPDGKALYVIERVWEDGIAATALRRVDLGSRRSREVLRMAASIDWFMTPVSRFEWGQGSDPSPFSIVFGARDGLYVSDPEGKRLRRLTNLPAVGLTNLEWNPRREQVALFFKHPAPSDDGRLLRGLYAVDTSEAAPGDEPSVVSIHPGTDVHTLWYSPKGTYVSWANREAIWILPAGNLTAEPAKLEVADAAGEPLEMRGFSWDASEARIVYAVEAHVYVYELASGASYLVTSFSGGLTAEPRWAGDDVVFSLFEDIALELWRRRNTPDCTLPLKEAKGP